MTGCVRFDIVASATIAPTTGVPTIKPALSKYSSNGKRDEFGYTEKAILVDPLSLNTSFGSITATFLRASMAREVVPACSFVYHECGF